LKYDFISCFLWASNSSLTLREEYGSRVFENRVLRRVFGAKRERVAGGWTRLHKEELHNLQYSSNIMMIK
jgi:hypothetical protein